MNQSLPSNPKIAVSAGELSGDQHLAHVVRELKARIPTAQVRGMGGRYLRAQGVDTVIDSEKSGGLMGFIEVLAKLPTVLHSKKVMVALLKEWKPDLLVVIDYPDFNLRLAKAAKSLGIKVLYFIPPKVWVWRKSRTKLLQQYTDTVACIFPHERAFLQSNGVPQAYFVGHPFSGNEQFRSAPSLSRSDFFERIGLDPKNPTVLFLPGSRDMEVERHCSIVFEGLSRIKKEIPSLQCVVSQAPTISDETVARYIPVVSWVRVAKTPALDLMKVCDAGLIKSGTSTLEAAFVGLPFACIYKAPLIGSLIFRCITNIRTYSLPNLVVPGTIQELIQNRFTPEEIEKELPVLLSIQGGEKVKKRVQKVVEFLSGCDSVEGFAQLHSAYARTAFLCEKMLR